jgi:hypothetical protein
MKKANKRKKTDKTTRQTHGNSHNAERLHLPRLSHKAEVSKLNSYFIPILQTVNEF